MARPARSSARRRPVGYRFEFLGFRDDWYLLRVDMSRPGEHLEAAGFTASVESWLLNQRITPGKWSHFGRGNTGEYPVLPGNEDEEDALYLLLKRPADVYRLSDKFPVIGLTVETVAAAVRAEANVHRHTIEDIAHVAHVAIHSLLTMHNRPCATWRTLDSETRVALIEQVRRRLDRLDEPVEAMHETWMDQRMKDGWHYGSLFDAGQHRDPLIVPWKHLHAVDQARLRLLAATVASLAPLLAD
jgi:hypothetical protein